MILSGIEAGHASYIAIDSTESRGCFPSNIEVRYDLVFCPLSRSVQWHWRKKRQQVPFAMQELGVQTTAWIWSFHLQEAQVVSWLLISHRLFNYWFHCIRESKKRPPKPNMCFNGVMKGRRRLSSAHPLTSG